MRPLIFHAPGDEGTVRSLKLQARVPVHAVPVELPTVTLGRPLLLRHPDRVYAALAKALRPIIDAVRKFADDVIAFFRALWPVVQRLASAVLATLERHGIEPWQLGGDAMRWAPDG